MSKFDPDFTQPICPWADIFHRTGEFLAGYHMGDIQGLFEDYRLTKKDQGPVCAYHQRRSPLGERRTVGMLPADNQGHGEEDALAAALMGYASGTRIVSDDGQGLSYGYVLA